MGGRPRGVRPKHWRCNVISTSAFDRAIGSELAQKSSTTRASMKRPWRSQGSYSGAIGLDQISFHHACVISETGNSSVGTAGWLTVWRVRLPGATLRRRRAAAGFGGGPGISQSSFPYAFVHMGTRTCCENWLARSLACLPALADPPAMPLAELHLRPRVVTPSAWVPPTARGVVRSAVKSWVSLHGPGWSEQPGHEHHGSRLICSLATFSHLGTQTTLGGDAPGQWVPGTSRATA